MVSMKSLVIDLGNLGKKGDGNRKVELEKDNLGYQSHFPAVPIPYLRGLFEPFLFRT
jgi:hypothetical protein